MQSTVVKSFHRGLDRDTDIRLMQNGNYLDAMNIKISNALSGRVGVVTNMLGALNISGTTLVGLTGDTVLNIFPDRINNCLYVFIANTSTYVDRIVKYVPATNTWSLVVASSILGFNTDYRINSFDVVENFIFWNDNYNPPRTYDNSLNYLSTLGYVAYNAATPYVLGNKATLNGIVYSALSSFTGNAPSGNLTDNTYWELLHTQGYDASYFDCAVLVPNRAPTTVVSTDSSFASNFLVGKFLQFKHRFVYKNNQKSVFSPISNVVYSGSDYDNPVTTTGSVPSNNLVTITVPPNNANKLVEKIEIAARSGNNGDFSIIKTFNTDSAFFSSGYNFPFYNNGISTSLAIDESNQLYDDMPLKARAARFASNRMLYAGTTNGYTKPTIDTKLFLAKRGRPDAATLTYTSTDMTCLDSAALLAAAMPTYTTPTVGDTITCTGVTSWANSWEHISFGTLVVTVGVGWGFADILAYILANTVEAWDSYTRYPSSDKKLLYLDGSQSVARNDLSIYDPNYGKTAYLINDKMSFAVAKGGTTHDEIFKSGARYQVGLQYYDGQGRTNGVILSADSEVYIPTVAERYLLPNDLVSSGGMYLAIEITNTPPSWAKYYNVVWANTYRDAAVITTTIIDARTVGALCQANIGSIKYSNTNHQTQLAYSWQKGDRVRFITYDASAGNSAGTLEWAIRPYDAEIIASDDNYAYTGEVGDGNQSISFYYPLTGTSNAMTLGMVKYSQIEIYRPSTQAEAEQVLFHEDSQMFDITGGLHEGTIDQTTTGTATSSYYGVYIYGATGYIKLATSSLSSAIKPGDVLTFTGTYSAAPATTFALTVIDNGVTYNGDGSVDVMFITVPWIANYSTAVGTISYSKTSKPAMVLLSHGDAFFKKRKLLMASDTDLFVEDYDLSDYIDSANYSLGRPTAIVDVDVQDNKSTIFYTESFIPNTNINGLNKLYPDLNYEEYNKSFGAITYIHNEGNAIILFQEDKVSQVMIQQALMYDGGGNTQYINSENVVLSRMLPYAGEYGMQNPFSFTYFGNRKYWIDLSRGVALRLSVDGITEISRAGLRGWFYDICKTTLTQTTAGSQDVFGIYDPVNDEYIVSFKYAQKTVCYNEEINEGQGGWSSFLSNYFTGGANLDNKVFYNNASAVYEMNQPVATVGRNAIKNVAGVSTGIESYIQFVVNDEPATDKVFRSISIDGNDAWDVSITTEQGQSSSLLYNADFRTRETEYDAAFLRDVNTPNVTNPLFEGDYMRGKEATIKLTMTSGRFGLEKYIKLVRTVISKG